MKVTAARGRSASLSLWLRLLKTHNLILRDLRRAMTAQGITMPRFEVLAQLAREPSGLTSRELARRLLVSAGNLTGIVARLESEGLVRREVIARDRRSHRIVLTPEGRRRASRLISRHRRDIERVLRPVAPATQERLRSLLGGILSVLEPPGSLGERTQGDHHAPEAE